jgi:hypothetical protein
MRYLATLVLVLAATATSQAGSFGAFGVYNLGVVDPVGKFAPMPVKAVLTPEQRVDRWFRRYLGRSATAKERNYGAGLLRQGATGNYVRGSVLGMREYYLKQGGTPVGFGKGLYLDVMGRNPTRPELQEVVAALANGTSRANVARGLLARRDAAGFFAWIASRP